MASLTERADFITGLAESANRTAEILTRLAESAHSLAVENRPEAAEVIEILVREANIIFERGTH